MKCINKITEASLEKRTFFFIFVVGIIMMFLIPTWQIPDEYAHLKMIGDSMGNEQFAEILSEKSGIERGRIEFNYDEKVNIEFYKKAMLSSAEYENKDLLMCEIKLSIIKHLPAALGIFLGVLLELPVYWVLQIGEIFSLLFYATVCYFSLKIMPIKKEMYSTIMVFPIALQQAGGIGYDAVLIPLCFYLIAYIFYSKYKKEITWKDLGIIFVIWIIVTYIKIPYCFIILLIFILPLEKIHLPIGKYEIDEKLIKKYRIPVCILGLLVICAGIFVLRNNKWIKLVIGMIAEWPRTLYLFKETGKTFWQTLMISTVGNFGWLDTPISFKIAVLVIVGVLLLALLNSDIKYEKTMRKWDKVVIYGTLFVLCIFTTMSMTNHIIMLTLYGAESIDATYNVRTALYEIPYIGGLQGRYYLPFISLFFLPLPQLKQISKNKILIFSVVFELLIFIYVVYVLANRYWIS